MNPQQPCPEYGELISAAVDDELQPAEWLRLDHHMQQCDGCRHLLSQFREMEDLCREPAANCSLARDEGINGQAEALHQFRLEASTAYVANQTGAKWYWLFGRLVPLAAAATVLVALFWITHLEDPSTVQGQQMVAPMIATPLTEINELNLARRQSQQQQGDVMGLELRALKLELGQLKDQSAAQPLIQRINQLLDQIGSDQ